MQIVDWFLNLFTIANIGYFVLGATATCGYHLVKARLTNRTVIIKWQYLVLPLAMAIVLNIALQTQANADCVREFNDVLRTRVQITTENDEVSREQRELIYQWIHGLIFPADPATARLELDDPRREQDALELTIRTDKRFRELIEQQRGYERQRAENPLPPATCGQ
jgi:hypothetical protein